LNDPKVKLESFILSNTPFLAIDWWGLSKDEFQNRHVLFQKDDASTYVKNILQCN